jgi:hypothetical protein
MQFLPLTASDPTMDLAVVQCTATLQLKADLPSGRLPRHRHIGGKHMFTGYVNWLFNLEVLWHGDASPASLLPWYDLTRSMTRTEKLRNRGNLLLQKACAPALGASKRKRSLYSTETYRSDSSHHQTLDPTRLCNHGSVRDPCGLVRPYQSIS